MDNFNLLESALKSLSLSDFDISTYLLLVRNGPLPITKIARVLSVERPTVYAAIDRLESKGLIPKNRPKHTPHVPVEPPSKVVAMLERQRNELLHTQGLLEVVLPEIQAAYTAKSRQSAFRLFEGKDQFMTVFEEVLKEAQDEILYYGDAESFIRYEGEEYEKRWARRRIARNLSMRILIFKNELDRTLVGDDPRKLRSTRYISPGQNFQSSFMVYGGKTLLWNPIGERAIVLDDPIMTDMFRATFERLWK